MAKITTTCHQCKAEIWMEVGQAVIDGTKLFWHGTYDCPHCDAAIHMDGGEDDIPDDIRQAILADEGEWELSIGDRLDAKGLKSLRQVLHLSLSDIAYIKQSLPGIVATGTRAEMEVFRARLFRQGVTATAQRTAANRNTRTLSDAQLNRCKEWFAELANLLNAFIEWIEKYYQALDYNAAPERFRMVRHLRGASKNLLRTLPYWAEKIQPQIDMGDISELLSSVRSPLVLIHGYMDLLVPNQQSTTDRKLFDQMVKYSDLLFEVGKEAEPFMDL